MHVTLPGVASFVHQDTCDRHVARLADELRALGLVGFRCRGRVEPPTATTNHVWWVRVTVRVDEQEVDLHGPASAWDRPNFDKVCARTLTRLFRSAFLVCSLGGRQPTIAHPTEGERRHVSVLLAAQLLGFGDQLSRDG
jgi:hypothetical protein